MIDRLIVSRVRLSGSESAPPGNNPERAIESHRDYEVSTDRSELAILFAPWHMDLDNPAYAAFARQLALKGFAVRRYAFRDDIIEPDIEAVKDSFERASDKVAMDYGRLSEFRSFDRIHLIGASLGCVVMANAASRLPDFNTATFIAGSSNLAYSLWHGSRTSALRQAFEDQGVGGPEYLDQAWSGLNPSAHAASFGGKTVNHVISLADEVIPTQHQFDLANDIFRSSGINTYSIMRSGHYMTIARSFLFPGKIIDNIG